MGVGGVIVVALATCWLMCVVLICAGMKRATRPPWWETMLLELDRLDVVVADQPTPAHRHTAV